MYEASFGLSRRPFPSLPQADFYYAASATEYARQTLVRCVQRGEGVAVVVGPTGCGKSLLGQMVAQHFQASMHVVQLASGRLDSRRALLQAILFGLGRPFRGMDEGELRLALTEFLSRAEERRPMLLIVDEAEALPMRLLDELRMTTNLAAHGQPCARLVLLGGPALEERLTNPRLESFSQRIVARCYVEAMNRTETRECIRCQLERADAKDVVFSDEACDAVYQATDGVPRLINQLGDHALILAFADGRTDIDRAVVEEAWADLQQLPTPWNGDAGESASQNIIEFGSLDSTEETFESAEEDDSESAYSVPALRVTPDEDDLIEQSSQRLDGIEESLERLEREDDFQPAGMGGPEIELVFHDPADLLNEDFQEEEPVVDRYSRSRASEPEQTYRVRSDEETLDTEPAAEVHSFETPMVAEAEVAETEASGTVEPEPIVAEEEVSEAEVAELAAEESEEARTLDMRSESPVPKLKHADFARLFSNLRRTAQ